VTVNCASLRDSLLESELFGHEKGAFTGASRARAGLFEMADRSTLFLDEVGDMNLEIQAKVLRAVQNGETRRLGSDHPRHVDVRIVAATNKELTGAFRAGGFREDLYYRLATIEIRVPPLRDRTEDVPILAQHFLEETVVTGKRAVRFSTAAMRTLQRHSWRGNVRELRNIVERIAILSESETVEESDVRIHLHGGGAPPEPGDAAGHGETLDDAERVHVARILARASGNKREAAKRLGVSLRTLYNKIHKHKL